jgi:hypothetical protein
MLSLHLLIGHSTTIYYECSLEVGGEDAAWIDGLSR